MNEHTIDRFNSKINKTDGCWLWAAHTDAKGYGHFAIDGANRLAHRISFEIANGYKPTICRHICDNPPCVNPKHLLDGTAKDNSDDRFLRTFTPKTHCKRGHEFTEQNTYSYKRSGTEWRGCVSCRQNASKKHYQRKALP